MLGNSPWQEGQPIPALTYRVRGDTVIKSRNLWEWFLVTQYDLDPKVHQVRRSLSPSEISWAGVKRRERERRVDSAAEADTIPTAPWHAPTRSCEDPGAPVLLLCSMMQDELHSSDTGRKLQSSRGFPSPTQTTAEGRPILGRDLGNHKGTRRDLRIEVG